MSNISEAEKADNELIEREFQALLTDYLNSNHRKKVDIIERAFRFAKEAHRGIRRRSGEPYILHPIAVARIVCREIGLGSTSICSALLHDVVEDTEYTKEGTPVLTANKAFILGYTSEVDGIYDKGNCIIFDDFTLDCKYVDFPFKVKSSAIKILTAKSNELLRYVYEFLKYLDLSTEEHKRHYIAETQNQGFILSSAKTVEMISHTFSALSLRLSSTVQLRNKYEAQKQHLLRQMFI